MPLEYPYIWAWGRLLGSFKPYIKGQVANAKADNAPADAIYWDEGQRRWHRWSEMSDDNDNKRVVKEWVDNATGGQ